MLDLIHRYVIKATITNGMKENGKKTGRNMVSIVQLIERKTEK